MTIFLKIIVIYTTKNRIFALRMCIKVHKNLKAQKHGIQR